jgi:hypothetical protein
MLSDACANMSSAQDRCDMSAGTLGAGRGCHSQACTRRSAVPRRMASLAAQCAAARPSGEPSIPAATCRSMVRTSCVHASGFLFSHQAWYRAGAGRRGRAGPSEGPFGPW